MIDEFKDSRLPDLPNDGYATRREKQLTDEIMYASHDTIVGCREFIAVFQRVTKPSIFDRLRSAIEINASLLAYVKRAVRNATAPCFAVFNADRKLRLGSGFGVREVTKKLKIVLGSRYLESASAALFRGLRGVSNADHLIVLFTLITWIMPTVVASNGYALGATESDIAQNCEAR